MRDHETHRRWLSPELLEQFQGHVPLVMRQSVASTNDVVLELFDGDWLAVTADEQVAGRGRLDRQWTSPPAAGIALSIAAPLDQVACPVVELPMRFGVAVVRAIRSLGVPAGLKWPNDVMVGGRKAGGMLIALNKDVAVLGVGINTHLREHELPTPMATSLLVEGHDVQREELIARIADGVRDAVKNPAPVLADYREACITLGMRVRANTMSGEDVEGVAADVDDDGALLVTTSHGQVRVTVADVVHLRPVTE